VVESVRPEAGISESSQHGAPPLVSGPSPHPEEPPTGPALLGRPDDKLRGVSKDEATDGASWFETALTRLLTMRVCLALRRSGACYADFPPRPWRGMS